jgi:hypothetical protein
MLRTLSQPSAKGRGIAGGTDLTVPLTNLLAVRYGSIY